MTDLTSGSRRISAVPVFWLRPSGANRSGRGSGRLVKAGFRLKADAMAFSAEGGQMSVMSEQSGQSVSFTRCLSWARAASLTCDAGAVAEFQRVPHHGPVCNRK